MMTQTWSAVLTSSFQNLWIGIIQFLPNVIIACAIFLIGWLIGSAIASVIAQLIKSLRVDDALRHAGFEEVTKRAGMDLDSGKFLGGLVKWFIIIAFLVASLDVLGLHQVNIFIQEVVLLYLPQVIAAVLILLIAAVIAEAAQTVVTAAARAANLRSARFTGKVAHWAIWVFAILAALNQLSVASVFVQTFFTGIVVAISLAIGLSFGLGGQDVAKHYLEHMREELKHHN
jgi:hypothetical protein